MLSLDGRAQRTLSTCRDTLQDLDKRLRNVDLDEKPPKPDKDSRAAHRLQSSGKSKELTAMSKVAKDLFKRMEKSPNKDHILSELEQLDKFSEAASGLAKLLTAALPDATDSEALCSTFEASQAAMAASKHFENIQLGPHFTLRYLMAKATQSCLYSKYADCWLHFCKSNDLVKDLAEQLDAGELEALMVMEAENRIVACLRTIQAQHLLGLSGSRCPEEGPLAEARNLCLAMLETASGPDSLEFLPASLCRAAQLAANILGHAEVEMSKLKKDAERLDALSTSLEEEDDSTEASAIERFFLQHPTGKTLWDLAISKVESGKKEADAEEALEKFAAEVTQFRFMAAGLGPSELISKVFEPLKVVWQDATQKAKALKTKKGALVSRNAEKINNRLDSVLVDFLAHLKEVSENLFSANLVECLRLACIRTLIFAGMRVPFQLLQWSLMCEALSHDGKVGLSEEAESEPSLINLDDIWPTLKQTHYVDSGFWKSLPPQEVKWLSEYKTFSEMLCQLGDFVFRRLPAFGHLPTMERSPTVVREWVTVLPEGLKRWLQSKPTMCEQQFEELFLTPCRDHLKGLFSSGLGSVSQIVAQCKSGMLGGGLAKDMQEQLLQQIPAAHPLRSLVCCFLEATLDVFRFPIFHFMSVIDFSADFRPQVAAIQRGDAAKADDLALCKGLLAMAEGLEKARAEASKHVDIKEALKASALDSVDEWLHKQGVCLGSALKQKYSSLCKSLSAESESVRAICEKLPSLTDESEYRSKTLQVTQALATASPKLDSSCDGVKGILKMVTMLDKVKFGFFTLDVPLNDDEASGLVATASCMSSVAAFHVTFVAGLCLLRSEDLGKSSPAGKQTLKSLSELVPTLQANLQKLADDTITAGLKAQGKNILDEVIALTASSKPAKKDSTAAAEKASEIPDEAARKPEKPQKEKKEKDKKDSKKEKDKDKQHKDKDEKKRKTKAGGKP
ncbi:unnamed protein product [Symbiodinium sp. CCMP2592]|nr:unnamed protein product [Symbiodinium sp. CCMP2592]